MTTGQIDSFSAHRRESPPLARLVGREAALLVVDMLVDFLHPGGRMPLAGGDVLYGPINRMAAAIRAAGGRVCWIRDEHENETDREFDKRTPHCIAGTGGSLVVPELTRDPTDRDLVKRRYSAFFGTDLDLWLRGLGIRHLVICGVVTNICVRSTVHDGFFLGYDVIVPTDGCLATGPREQASSLYDIETHFGRLATSDEVCAALHMVAPLTG